MAKDVPAMGSLENMSDLFVKVRPEGCEAQTTDTHWRAKKGKASWNWRLLFEVSAIQIRVTYPSNIACGRLN